MNRSATIEPEVLHKERGGTTAIVFDRGIPGLEDARRWELVENEELRPFYWLRSLDQQPLTLLVVEPRAAVRGYRPDLTRGVYERLGAAPGSDVVIFCIVTLTADGAATVNLRAPLVVSCETMRGEQVILEQPHWPIRHRLVEAGLTDEGTGRSPQCSSSAAK